ncbi:hypothetical protein ABFS83_01G039100 [Erythranthe nasuta]
MHVGADLNWFLQFVVFAFVAAFGLLYLVRNTASRYFMVDSNFDSSAADYSSSDSRKAENMAEAGGGAAAVPDSCAVCGLATNKQCSRCKMVKYCSGGCQKSHWDSGHKTKCKDLLRSKQTFALRGKKGSVVAMGGSSKIIKQSNKILFPYEEFIEFFNWDKPGYPPCGLLNCGNSCFANVVLQCLAYTRPLVAYVLEKGHRSECQKDDWCFLCEFQIHVERASRSLHPFSPMNILSRLPNIGGNLGYGKQEDSHEFMRFAIDTMQSVCLDEFGGEKAVHPSYQETTLIQHIFGGRLRSQVICAECDNVSNQFENLMDLTVEIHGDAGSLEECLDQFTAKEWLHGDNMYKCDGCNAYVMAWKRLTIQRAPNILTIALKRFQSGRFGKLNKRVNFPETLDLRPYMSELEDGNDVYKLYAVIVHVDMLNASFFGHYICYVKDFRGSWYRIDDCKVANVDLDEVLSQGAYMLLYSRIYARPSCLLPTELLKKEESENVKITEVDSSLKQLAVDDSGQSLSANSPEDAIFDNKIILSDLSLPIVKDAELHNSDELPNAPKEEAASHIKHDTQQKATDTDFTEVDAPTSESPSSITELVEELPNAPKEEAASHINHDTRQKATNTDFTEVDAPTSQSPSSITELVEELPNAPKEVAFDTKHDPQQRATTTTLFDTDSTEVDAPVSQSPSSITELHEESSDSCDVSSMAITTEEVRDEANTANSIPIPENVGHVESVPSSVDVKNVAKKSNAKLKPLFAPGFLEKQPRKKCSNKLDSKLATESIDPKNRSSCENGLMKKEKPQTVHGNGNGSIDSDICNGYANGNYIEQNAVRGSS